MIASTSDSIDQELAAVLRGDGLPELCRAITADPPEALKRVHYHGLAGLLAAKRGWPEALEGAIRREAVARAMWELRHRQQLLAVLKALEARNIRALLLKGTALAYDLYDEPACRTRGDTDLWVQPENTDKAREVLSDLGFENRGEATGPEALHLEEGWSLREKDRHHHLIDLHWSAINSICLRELFDFDRCWESRKALPRLGPGAWSLGDGDALLHAAVHRRLHVVSPYEVDGRTYYGGDRLIWAMDVHLLARRMGPERLTEVAEQAAVLGLGAALGEALDLSHLHLGTPIPALPPRIRGAAARTNKTADYLAGGQVRRAFLDLAALPGIGHRLSAVRHRIMPSRRFLEAKYGEGDGSHGIVRLLVRRIRDFFRPRTAGSSR